jgi:hypothetical protein
LPDNTVLYIKNADPVIQYALQNGSPVRVYYDKNISVYFEGGGKKFPERYSEVYYFTYDPKNITIRFIEKTDKLLR